MRTCGSAPGPSCAKALSSAVRPEWPRARSIRAAMVALRARMWSIGGRSYSSAWRARANWPSSSRNCALWFDATAIQTACRSRAKQASAASSRCSASP